MDRDTLMDDLDLILERSRDDELPGEWDWEPPLGTGGTVVISASDPGGAEVDGPDDETEDDADNDEEEEEEDD